MYGSPNNKSSQLVTPSFQIRAKLKFLQIEARKSTHNINIGLTFTPSIY